MVTASNRQDRSQKVNAPESSPGSISGQICRSCPAAGPVEAAAPSWRAAWQGCGSVGSEGWSLLRRSACPPLKRRLPSCCSGSRGPPPLSPRSQRLRSLSPTKKLRSLPLLPVGTAQHSGYVQGNDFLVSGPGLESRRWPCRVVSPGKALPQAQLPPQRNGWGHPDVYPPHPSTVPAMEQGLHSSGPTSPPPLLGCVLTVWPGEGARW